MKSNHKKIFVLLVCSAVVCALGYGASKQSFGELVNNRFQIEHFSKNKPNLYLACQFWNQSDDPHHLRPTVVIRGVQDRSGDFFPCVKLAVGPSENGPWTSIEAKMPQDKKTQLTIPVTIRVVPLNVDCAPFIPYLSKMKWAKITLPSGDAIVVDLKEVRDAWKGVFSQMSFRAESRSHAALRQTKSGLIVGALAGCVISDYFRFGRASQYGNI